MLFRISIKEVDVFSLLRVVVKDVLKVEIMVEVKVTVRYVAKVMNQEFNLKM